jgi:hypothetical protein
MEGLNVLLYDCKRNVSLRAVRQTSWQFCQTGVQDARGWRDGEMNGTEFKQLGWFPEDFQCKQHCSSSQACDQIGCGVRQKVDGNYAPESR